MREQDRKQILSLFSKYYKTFSSSIPSIEQREFGVGFHKKIEARHLAFDSAEQLRNYLINNTPFYVSFSSAYYEHPEATPIERKGWMGADLIFDLDVHVEGGDKYSVYASLEQIKQDALRLSEEFLQDDFGISKNEIYYVFSGNRGYHIHVRSDAVRSLGSKERREMVDYIRGVGLNFRSFFTVGEKARGRISGPSPDSSGYKGRFVRAVLKTLESKPSSIYRGFSNREKRNNFIEGIKGGNWSRSPLSFEKLCSRLEPIAAQLPLLSVDVDAAVTYDIKKLIRLPNSIHGSTGFIAKEVKNMDSFNPLSHALIPSKSSLNVLFVENVPNMVFGENTLSFKKGEKKELPLPQAVFFILKGAALIN